MLIELECLFNNEGCSIEVNSSSDFSDYELNASKPFTSPVKTIGSIKNTAGVVELKATAFLTIEFNCDRCAESSSKKLEVPVEHTLVTSLNNEDNDELMLVENLKLDLDDLILTDILLFLPTKLLCSEACMGVCAGCGRNLNKESCRCKKEIDPRLEVLKSLLEDQ